MIKKKGKMITALCGVLATGSVIIVPVIAVEAGTISIDANGGSWISEENKKNNGSIELRGTVRLLENGRTNLLRDNHYLAGYTTNVNGTGGYYYFGETVALNPADSWVTKFPDNNIKLYAKWKQYKTTKTINLKDYKFTQFTNDSLKGKGYVPEGGEVYKKDGNLYFVASWYDKNGKSNNVKLVKYNYKTGKSTGVTTTQKMYHSNGLAYGEDNIYVAPGNDDASGSRQENYVFRLGESKLNNFTSVNFSTENFKDVCQAIAYKDGKLFAEFPNGRIVIFDIKTNKIENVIFAEGHLTNERYGLIQGMAVNGNKIYLLACNSKNEAGDQKIFVYDYTASKGNWKEEEWTITGAENEEGKNNVIEDISFVDGKMYLIRGGDHICGVYDLSTGNVKKTGWKNENGKIKYYGKDGKAYTGWKKMGAAEGETTPHWSYFGDDGALRFGWQAMGKGTNNPDGNTEKHYSYFGENGWLRTGWQKMGKGTSNPDGNCAVHFSYFGDNGWLRTGWQAMGKGTKNAYGENSARHTSYFGSNGWLRTGIVTLGKADGEKVTHKSYFGDNGWLRVNTTFKAGNTKYRADGRGWLTVIK